MSCFYTKRVADFHAVVVDYPLLIFNKHSYPVTSFPAKSVVLKIKSTRFQIPYRLYFL